MCSNCVMAQRADSKIRINAFHKPADIWNINGLRAIHGINLQSKLEKNASGASPGVAGQNHSFAKTEIKNGLKVNLNKPVLTDDQILDSMIYELWESTSNQWILDEKTWYSYSDEENSITEYNFYWDENTSQWFEYLKFESTYDAYGNMTLFIAYSWDETASQWLVVEQHKNEITRDANDSIILNIDQVWDESNSQWVNSEKYEYTNDDNGNKILLMYYEWDETESQWVNTYKAEYTYDGNGNNNSIIVYWWDESGSQWLLNEKYEYTYDDNRDNILSIYYEWDVTESLWVNYYKEQYTYDENGNILSYASHEWSGSQWDAYDKETFYYSGQVPTLNPDIAENHISVYPNPAYEYVIFDLEKASESATVELFSVDGKKVLEQKLSENRQISVSSLPKGLYMYKVSNSGNSYTGKLLIEK